MDHVNYLFQIAHRPASRARVLLNGVPLYDREPDKNVTPRGPVSHWLLPGENTVSIELESRPPSPRAPFLGPHFAMAILTADEDATLFSWEFPASVIAAGEVPALPCVHGRAFLASTELPQPVFMKGSLEDFPVEGTAAQRDAVAELYDAFAAGDGSKFSAAMELKFAEFERYYGPQPGARADSVSRLREPWVMEPFDPQDLRFDRYLGGRVAYVRRESGKPAVRAQHRDVEFMGWGSDLFLTRLDGRWRVFR